MARRYVYEPLVSPFLQDASEALRNGFYQAHYQKNPLGGHASRIRRLYPDVHINAKIERNQHDLSVNPRPDDTLYVLLYGQVGSPLVGAADTPDGPQYFTPPQLAKHLSDQRLNKNFQDLRILVSASGSPYYEDGPSFASLLRDEMKKLKYDSIRVTGYLGNFTDYGYAKRLVLSDDGSGQFVESARKHKGVTLEDGTSHRASAFKVTYH